MRLIFIVYLNIRQFSPFYLILLLKYIYKKSYYILNYRIIEYNDSKTINITMENSYVTTRTNQLP